MMLMQRYGQNLLLMRFINISSNQFRVYLQKKFVECNKIVKKMAFERAINVDRPEKTLAEMYQSLDAISIEEDYTGPKLENEETVTLEFMKELMQWYKDQKKLHKKYAYKVSLITIFWFLDFIQQPPTHLLQLLFYLAHFQQITVSCAQK